MSTVPVITKSAARQVFVAWSEAAGIEPGDAFTGEIDECGIYAAACLGRLKIGYSCGPTHRIRQLRGWTEEGRLVAYSPVVVVAGCGQRDEHALHRALRSFSPFNVGVWKCEYYPAGSPVGALASALASHPDAIVAPCPVGRVRQVA